MKSSLSFVFLGSLTASALLAAAPADHRAVIARADLDYTAPASRSEEGMPVGNGRIGSLVWTTPTQLKFQINHVNVYGINSETNSFPIRHSDYATSCGFLDVNFVDYGDPVFAGAPFHQHLSVYDGLMTARGNGVVARVIAWPQRDVMAIEVEDTRAQPVPVSVDLRMLRYQTEWLEDLGADGNPWTLAENHQVMVRRASHTATSGLVIRDGRIALTQQFREKDFYGASGVAVAVVGRGSQARYLNETTVQLTAAPGRGKFTILIGAVASFDPKQDLAGRALTQIAEAAPKSFAALQGETAAWWRDFWSRGFVGMHSADGQADFVDENYNYFLYLMNASSHGDYPPRFGGMIWYTNGDMRAWGSEHWWANTSAYYRNLMPAGRLDLMEPMFKMYFGLRESAARAAKQQWGSAGIWIPETVWFDGLENLPDDIAAEMRDLYLGRKPWAERSAGFVAWAATKMPHSSRYSWVDKGKFVDGRWVFKPKNDAIAFGHTSHIFTVAARVADLFWQRYQFTMDEAWLRDRAYPLIKGAAEFYRNFPNFQKGADGKYHIHHVNNGENDWNSSDSPSEVAAMKLIFPLAARAAELLNVDAGLQAKWREIAENLVAQPARPGAPAGATVGRPSSGSARGSGGFGAFVAGTEGGVAPLGAEPELKARFLSFTRTGGFVSDSAVGGAKIFRNRLRLREGPGAPDAEHIGGLASGVHSSLLNSAPASEEGEPVLQLFSTWPKDWDAEFTLLARGAFVVTAAQQGGKTGPVEIVSNAGSTCRLTNPWAEAAVKLTRDGKPAETLRGAQLEFPTKRGEKILLNPI
jgi:hypothetical protein